MSGKQAIALNMLVSLLDGEKRPDTATMRDVLHLIVRQGNTLQARILLALKPRDSAYLELLPKPAWFDECWPGQGWTLTEPSPSDPPYFSVVTPSYNQGVFLQDTIASVMRQGFAAYEHIVMDGGSTDSTLDLLRSYPHLRWTSEPDRGQTHALNKALAQARGEVIAWINSDDFYLPGTFQAVHDFFTQHPDACVVTGDCLWGWEQSGRLRYITGKKRDFESLIRQWTSHVPGPQPSIFFRRRVLEQIGLGDENFHYGMDYDLWLRMAMAGHVRQHVPVPMAFYRFHGGSKSGAQQDWSPFYHDWQACFDRHRSHSRILPQERMLAVAYPLRAGADALERARLCAALKLCAQWKMRDIELLLITDVPKIVAETVPPLAMSAQLQAVLPGLPALSLPLTVVPQSQLDGVGFVQAAVGGTTAFALCLPPISSAVPFEQWYEIPLNNLLDAPQLPYASLMLRRGRLEAHPLLSPDGPLSCLAMHRRTSLADSVTARLAAVSEHAG